MPDGIHVNTYKAENGLGRAEVYNDNDSATIHYYDANGNAFYHEQFPDLSLAEVENLAEDWALGYHVLIG